MIESIDVKTSSHRNISDQVFDSDIDSNRSCVNALKQATKALSNINGSSATVTVLNTPEIDEATTTLDKFVKSNQDKAAGSYESNSELESGSEYEYDDCFLNNDTELYKLDVEFDYDTFQNFKHRNWKNQLNHPQAKNFIDTIGNNGRTITHNIISEMKKLYLIGFSGSDDCSNIAEKLLECITKFDVNLNIHIDNEDGKTAFTTLLELQLIIEDKDYLVGDSPDENKKTTDMPSLVDSHIERIFSIVCRKFIKEDDSFFKKSSLDSQHYAISLAIMLGDVEIISDLIRLSRFDSLEDYYKTYSIKKCKNELARDKLIQFADLSGILIKKNEK